VLSPAPYLNRTKFTSPHWIAHTYWLPLFSVACTHTLPRSYSTALPLFLFCLASLPCTSIPEAGSHGACGKTRCQEQRCHVTILTGLLRGHYHLTGHIFKLGMVYSPRCDRFKQTSEMVSRLLCDCDAPVPSSLETEWFCRHLHQQDTALCSRWRAA